MSHLFEAPLVVVGFFPLWDTELKNDQETPSERMNNHFIEILKAHCAESHEVFFHTFPKDQTFFSLIKKYVKELAYSIPGGVE